MSDAPLSRLRELTLAAARDLAHVEDVVAAAGAEPARPGDLLSLDATSHLPLEWAVVERGRDGATLLVPADTHPFATGDDIVLPPEAGLGALVLRCRLALAIDAADLGPWRRAARVPDEAIGAARRAVAAARAGGRTGAGRALAEASPSQRVWLERVAIRGRALLQARVAEVPPPASSWWRRRWVAAATAAAMIAVVVAAGSSMRQRAPARVAFAWLSPAERLRGDPSTLTLDGAAPSAVLVVDVSGVGAAELEVEILREPDLQPVWRSAGLHRSSSSEIALLVPAQLLPRGDYLVRAHGVDDAAPPITYRFRVSTAGRGR